MPDEDRDSAPPPTPPRCALCDDAETLTWVEVAAARGGKHVAVCSACFLDLQGDGTDDGESDD